MMNNRIEICGNIASGKTSLCRNLQSKGYLPIFENFQANPFYEAFYQNPTAYSFETGLTFLLQHYHSIKVKSNFANPVCDYSYILDMAYADVNLSGNRHRIFSDLIQEIQEEIGPPLKIIYLVCSKKILLERIVYRERKTEFTIDIKYLQDLSHAIQSRINALSSQTDMTEINSELVNFTRIVDEQFLSSNDVGDHGANT